MPIHIPLPGAPGAKPPPLSKRVFTKYDKDGNNAMDLDEFRLLCQDNGHFFDPASLATAFRRIDTSGDGYIQYEEFVSFWQTDGRFAAIRSASETERKTVSRAIELFEAADTDGNGVIDATEFRTLFATLVAEKMTTKSLERALEDLDTDGNGNISFNELVLWLLPKERRQVM
mmetsp:Transcript_3792/g.12254  ORF Transcript_3792/g.12254 Transcript_3792/m.12254 type:complete len:173 (-) Transcript_3792:48-566(-)